MLDSSFRKLKKYKPGTGPQTLGIISKIAEHDGSSKQSWRAIIHFKIAGAVFIFGPTKKKKINKLIKKAVRKVHLKCLQN